MIYPRQFPAANENPYEREVYIALSNIMDADAPENDDYDVFCFRKFSALTKGEQIEYEIDFIVADIKNGKLRGVLVIEVKGHTLVYEGLTSKWVQDGGEMKKSPTEQATKNMRSLFKRFSFLESDVPMGWAVWFPRMVFPGKDNLPTELTEEFFFDEISKTYTKEKLVASFRRIYEQWPHKRGASLDKYNLFKEPLVRDFGFALPLHRKIEAAEIRFIELTKQQLDLLRVIKVNKNILVTGPAGSGKTIMATTIAREIAETSGKVLILVFNRVLANNIRYGMGKIENPEVSTYHSIARRFIDEVDENWWGANSKNENFWDLEVPAKFEEVLIGTDPMYDAIIIDEAQDLQELWFENIDRLLKPEGSCYVFIDEDQDIFGAHTSIKINRDLFTFPLVENCRNTVNIIGLLKSYIKKEIGYRSDAVEGEPVRVIEYGNDVEQMNLIRSEWLTLVENENISPDRILLMMNADKRNSCLANTKQFGRYKIESLQGKTGQLRNNRVNYSSIRSFKGLEVDVVFIIDTDKVENPDYRVLYTQASRAKYLLVIFARGEH